MSASPLPLVPEAVCQNLIQTLIRGRTGGAAVEVQVRAHGEAHLLEPRARHVPHRLGRRKQARVTVESYHVGVG